MTDRSDYVFYAALMLLPADGTVLGWYMPFWTPISPWLLMLYTALNWRLMPIVYHRFRRFLLFPLVALMLSMIGWATVAFHPLPALWSFLGLAGALACLASLEIAVRIKRLDWRHMIRIILIAYWIAFAVGVVQFLAIHLDITFVRDWFSKLMAREYITADSPWGGNRPQFLFAEPSYIGMHLYGVLLPLMWMMRGRDRVYVKRLRNLIIVFAAGSILMGAGVRIIIDTGVALLIAIIETLNLHDRRIRKRAFITSTAIVLLTAAAALTNGRVRSIVEQGPLAGDTSSSARLSQTLTPVIALIQHPMNLFTGFGAGNIAEANRLGTTTAYAMLNGPDAAAPWWVWKNMSPDSTFTMSAYTSFITEFGLIGLTALVVIVISHISERHLRNRTTICWLILVAYLYVQFEGYAFYALPLFIWGMKTNTASRSAAPLSAWTSTPCP
ncbi:hypothetical protein [Bifidobacterium sp. UTBIF-78]|uniref:hypothetical protein n=1 Tax=Bifidobacterium sp. UTBIF-78 TaxID=1465263 RepID=UPI001128D9D9|nr:hypothetical protein [Bifidobacterium sp. UTBIF-78]TPF93370.1 hypothetical protein BG22_07340 [Bifidobacterium sp. UTBIF-78]